MRLNWIKSPFEIILLICQSCWKCMHCSKFHSTDITVLICQAHCSRLVHYIHPSISLSQNSTSVCQQQLEGAYVYLFSQYIFICKPSNDDAIHSSTTKEWVYIHLATILKFRSLLELHILDYILGKTNKLYMVYARHIWMLKSLEVYAFSFTEECQGSHSSGFFSTRLCNLTRWSDGQGEKTPW